MGYSPFGCGQTSDCCDDPCDGGVIGPTGKSAYQIAVERGFVGTEDQWLATLKGAKGDQGNPGLPGAPGTPGKDGVDGINGTIGVNGESAYQVAVDNGFVGTEAQWLASLVGPKGDPGPKGDAGPQGPTSVTGYRISGFAVSNILGGEVLIDHVVTQAFNFAANFAGSKVEFGTGPAANWVASIQKNGVQVGTLTIGADGLVTWATTGGAAVAFAVNDLFTLVAPAVADGTIARLCYTFEGAVS